MAWDELGIIIGLASSFFSIVFAYIAFRRSNKDDLLKEGKNEGLIISDIGYIKACVDRVEKNLNVVDERYRNVSERLVKLEEGLSNIIKRVDEIR